MAEHQPENGNVRSRWSPYQPAATAPWDLRRVVHLHRRAAFAAPWAQLQRDLTEGPQAAVERLLQGDGRVDEAHDFEEMARAIGDAAMASGSPGRLKAWWIYRMLLSPDPLGERLTLMWHNHFATSNRKVQDLARMRDQNEQFRQHARAPFGQLLEAVVKHPAMLVWLDADSNRKGHPNENLARELMELFTLGIGHYTEQDVQEAARALTGWTIVGQQFGRRAERHDGGEKVILGRHGALSGDDLLSMLLAHPATARRLAWRIGHTFLGEGVADELAMDELAGGLTANGLNIGWAVGTVLRSQLFFSDANIRTRVLGPTDYIVGALRALELCNPPPSTLLLAEWATRMGQDLFYPPNVGGWNEGRAWLGSRMIVARANFASALTEGRLRHESRPPDLAGLLRHHGQSGDFDDDASWMATLLWGEAPPPTMQEVIAAARVASGEGSLRGVVAQLLVRPEHYLA